MIRVKVKPEGVLITGHAEYDEYGKDIVCSSVSSIVTTTVNAILILNDKAIKYDVKEGLVKIDIVSDDETTRKLIDNMVSLFIDLTNDYPKNIKVERE